MFHRLRHRKALLIQKIKFFFVVFFLLLLICLQEQIARYLSTKYARTREKYQMLWKIAYACLAVQDSHPLFSPHLFTHSYNLPVCYSVQGGA